MTSAWGGRQVRRIDQRPRQKTAAGSGPAPSPGVIVARRVIIVGPNGGLFVYSPVPGAGNLVASIAAQAGTDSFGNTVVAGVAAYGPGGEVAELTGGVLRLFNSLSTTSGFISAPTGFGGELELVSGLKSVTDSAATFGLFSKQQVPAPVPYVAVGGSTNFMVGVFPPNTTANAEIDGSLAVGPVLGQIREWYSPSGGDDFAALNTALSSYGSADLLPAAYQLSANLSVAGATLQGCDEATTVSPFGAYAGVLMTARTKGVIRNLSVTNGGADAIQIAAGITDPWLLDLYFANNAGRCISAPSVTGPLHARIRGIRGASGASANGGGILLDGGTGGAITCEANIYDLDIQGLTASEVLRIQGVTDVLVSKVNGSIASGVASNAISVLGACQTVHLLGLDVGGSASTNATCFVGAGTSVNSPTDCRIEGKLQTGQSGLFVSDAVSRSRFYVDCTRNQLDGARFNDTGTSNKLMYMGNVNNQSAGVAYDINVQNTGHLFIDAPQYGTPGGGAVTANLNIVAAGNHVTHFNPPAGSTNVGVAPAGW